MGWLQARGNSIPQLQAFYVIEYTLVSTTVWQADNRKTLGFIACQQAVVGGRLEPQLVGSLVARMFPEAQAQQTVAKWFLALSACGLTKVQKALWYPWGRPII